jgi:uncharacterized damage-inducible protein DinB
MHGLVGTVRQLLLYTLWADRICLEAAEEVRPDDLVRAAGISFGSLLGTLTHMLQAQRLWLARFEGKSPERQPGIGEFPDLQSLGAAWAETSAELEFFLAALTDDQVTNDLSWTTAAGATHTRPLWQPVMHLVNHTTYHRGQVASLLRQMGYAPPSTDLIAFLLGTANKPRL